MDFLTKQRTIQCYIVILYMASLPDCTTVLTSNSACFGNVATGVTKMNLNCQSGTTIVLTSVTAGAKATSTGCPSSFSDAMTQDIACCSQSTNTADDCTFVLSDTTDFEQSCNGQESCVPEAKNVDATGQCDMTFPATTIFMFINYECTSVPSNNGDDSSDDLPIDAIVGGILGGVVVVSVAGIAGYCIWKKAAQKRHGNTEMS